MKRPLNGHAVFYTRDSGGKHEMTPGQYVNWAVSEAQKRTLRFTGTPAQIEAMIRNGQSAEGDLFVDFAVKGNLLTRVGLEALKLRALHDPEVSHIFIPHRNRLARPDNPVDGVVLEQSLREAGLTLVFLDRVCDPIPRGSRQKLEDLLVSLLDYNYAGEYRTELARKILHAQIALARRGFSTGGRPPHGFDRWLVKDDGTKVRKLADGERVRMAGHHVVWLPGAEDKLRLNGRIIQMLKSMPVSRVAAALNAEGIPSPDAGRMRRNNGIRHRVSGVWHQTTITRIVRNPLLVAIATYGRRSMGDQLRFSPDGPRPLDETRDFSEDKKRKVVVNAASSQIQTPVSFEPLVSIEEHQEVLRILDQRGSTQRNKPRAYDPAKNPLGCRVFDMNCSWPMYRQPYGQSFRYTCGLYQQSQGQQCTYNNVYGPLAAEFVLTCLRQRLLAPSVYSKLKRRLRELAAVDHSKNSVDKAQALIRDGLEKVRRDIKQAERNLAFATSPENFRGIEAIIAELRKREQSLAAQQALSANRIRSASDEESEVEAALRVLDRLAELAAGGRDYALAKEAFNLTNAKLFLRFQPVPKRRRNANRIASGVVTFGEAPPPIAPYEGPTSRKRIKKLNSGATGAVRKDSGRRSPTGPTPQNSGRERDSLGNVTRGESRPPTSSQVERHGAFVRSRHRERRHASQQQRQARGPQIPIEGQRSATPALDRVDFQKIAEQQQSGQ